MVFPHTPEQAAYQAGGDDYRTALDRVQRALEQGDIQQPEAQQLFLDTLTHLWQRRIDRGELPAPLEKAS
jgi:hypothetical protein